LVLGVLQRLRELLTARVVLVQKFRVQALQLLLRLVVAAAVQQLAVLLAVVVARVVAVMHKTRHLLAVRGTRLVLHQVKAITAVQVFRLLLVLVVVAVVRLRSVQVVQKF